MHLSLNWIKEFVDLKGNLTPEELGKLITLKTAEIDGVEDQSKNFDHMCVGKIIELKAHPNADKLKVTIVDVGNEKLQIVCGGINLKEGMDVAITKIGAKVKWHGEGDLVTLEKTKIRDVESFGMIAAGSEIGIPDPEAKEREILDLSKYNSPPGTPLAELFDKNDIILEVDNKAITHRPDLWSHYGFAREIAAITDTQLKPLTPKVEIPTQGESPKVDVKDKKLCTRYLGLIIENIKVAESPKWLQDRLLAIGHGSHSNIVDVTNYVMAELGQPLHAFDKSKIANGITVRKAKKGEKTLSLDDKERTLSSDMLVIADDEKVVAIAGVMGSKNSAISNDTTSIILESATFNSSSVRKTSTKLNLRTDAVQRFEKALDPHLAELAIKRAAELILQVCPEAKISGPATDVKNFSEKPLEINLSIPTTISKIGVPLSREEIKNLLEKLEFKVVDKSKTTLRVTIPTFRATKDVTSEDDLIEEVARLYGYDNIPATFPILPTTLPAPNFEREAKHLARNILSAELGFNEVNNYSFYGQADLSRCLIPEHNHVLLQNYLSEDQTHLRTSLVPNIFKNIQENAKYFDDFKIYEIGRTYKEIGQFYPLEEKIIAGAISTKGKHDEVFYLAKGAVETIFEEFHITMPKPVKEVEATPYAHPFKCLSYIDTHGHTLAKVFFPHPQVSKNHDLEKHSIALFEINFTELMKLEKVEKKYKKLPKFPSIQIDISILTDKNTEVGTFQKAIMEADHLITEVKLFDIYEGDRIDAGKKAVAFSITLQAQDRTLTDEEMLATQKKIFTNVENLGGTVRGK